MTFAEYTGVELRRWREQDGMSIQEAADKCFICYATYGARERHGISNLNILQDTLDALEYDLHVFLECAMRNHKIYLSQR